MKHNWSLIVVVLFMLGAGVAERFSAFYVQRLGENDKELAQRIKELSVRTDGRIAESKKYQEIEHLAALVQDHIQWEPDSTRVMRWFGDAAAKLGVRLVATSTVPVESASQVVGGGAYRRMRIEARLTGSFWNLLQYVDNIEHSVQPMVIESLTMTADRDRVGTGELRITVSALYPVASGATIGGAR